MRGSILGEKREKARQDYESHSFALTLSLGGAGAPSSHTCLNFLSAPSTCFFILCVSVFEADFFDSIPNWIRSFAAV